MALETGTYISDLVATNPTSTDPKSEGDNHLRLIKSFVKATFPNVTGAVTKTHTQLNNTLDKTGDTMTGPLAQAAGTAALPSYTFSGDTNTGIYSPGADILAWSTAGSERLRIDTSGNVLVTGSGGLGYGVGSGGTVTQATNKSTAVTLNKPVGTITTHNENSPAGSSFAFFLVNNLIQSTDLVCVSVADGNALNYAVSTGAVSAGQVGIYVRNVSGGARAENIPIRFAVIKGANS